MSPHPATCTSTSDAALPTVLARAGRALAAASRQEQGLPPHVEDAEAVAGFVELWHRSRPARRYGGGSEV
jgi:hypothetical protein